MLPIFLYICHVVELERIYGILVSFLGESKQGGYDQSTTQYQFNCPYCAEEKGAPDGKYNCECNFEKLLFHCWADDESGSFSKIIKRFGGRKLLKEYFELVKALKSSKLYEFLDDTEKIRDREPIKLPKTYKKMNLSTCPDKMAVSYLKSRHIDQWTINKFNIGYTSWEDDDKSMSNRIIVPSYDEFGRLNYFVGRDFMPEKEDKKYFRAKYKNCEADKLEIVFQESTINPDADITLTEGALDCIYGPNTIALLGKFLNQDSATFRFLVERANARVIICLDNDTTLEQTLRICRLLNTTRLSGRIWYIEMDEYKDFGEAYEKDGIFGIAKCLRSAKKYDEDKDFLYE